ncbi:MAG: hypothetical protein GXP62_04150 [Oligoflexia bacterium]|nr:hypothetical protein [Oligoflexia bacterium]
MFTWLLALASLVAAVGPAIGADRATLTVGEAEGLQVGATITVAQDRAGFMWAGTQSGVARFDGERFVPIGTELFSGWVWDLAPAPDGSVYVSGKGGPYRITAEHMARVPNPGASEVSDICVDDRGVAYAVDGQRLFAGGPDRWVPVPIPEDLAPDRVRCEQGPTFLIGASGVWQGPAGSPTSEDDWIWLASPSSEAVDAVAAGDGSTWVLPSRGPLLHIQDGQVSEIPLVDGRHSDLQIREGTLWVSSVYALTAIHADGRIEVMDRDDGYHSHGVMALDRESGLWMATKNGLVLYPEEAAHYDRDDGLADELVRRVSSDGTRVWASAWGGFSSVMLAPTGAQAATAYKPIVRSSVCVRDGEMWAMGQDYRPDDLTWASSLLVHARDGQVQVSPGLPGVIGYACALDAQGQPWTASDTHLVRIDGDHLTQTVPLPQPGGELHNSGSIGDAGDLWWLGGPRACLWVEQTWRCTQIEGADELTDVLDRPDGSVWFASRARGVVALRWTENGKARLRDLGVPVSSGANRALRLAASPRGGVWVVGVGFTVRADYLAQPASPARIGGETQGPGWRILERLDFRNGLDHSTNAEVLELDDGTLWVATYAGLMYLPASARDQPPDLPRLALTGLSSDGVDISDGPIALPWRGNHVTVGLAALTYRDRRDLRYRVRLHPQDPWLIQAQPTIQLADLAPDSYRLEAQTSLDGEHWSPPLVRTFSVDPPPWNTVWAWLGYLGLGGALVYAAHRTRLRRELALERERQRIALDLHDELGSGLGSIGLGAGLLTSPALPQIERAELANRLASQAREMGSALTEIVWSLRTGPVSPSALLDQLELRGQALLVGSSTSLHVEPTDAPGATRMSPAMARSALLIGLEALHNAARHAQASQLQVRLHTGPRRWTLEVEDDGRGLAQKSANPGGGNGLASMRQRASRMGASLEWKSTGSGTLVRLSFDPTAQAEP